MLSTSIWNLIETQRNRLWVLPLIIVVFFILLALVTLGIDDWQYESETFSWPVWLFKGDVTAAQTIVTSVATATASIMSLVISMTMIVFSIASSQYGPMLLRNFIVDVRLQLMFGGFVGTFAYCLLTLSVMNYAKNEVYAPELSVAVVMGLSLLGLFGLLYILHHVATSLRVETLVGNVCAELKSTLKRRFPEKPPEGECSTNVSPPEDLDSANFVMVAKQQNNAQEAHTTPWFIASESSGYIQTIDDEAILALAEQLGVQVRCWVRAGHFVITGQTLFSLTAIDITPDIPKNDASDAVPHLRQGLLDTITIGQCRTPADDPEFAIDQLVEIALVALSPGVNRTYTAIMCVDQLTEALAWVVRRRYIPGSARCGKDGTTYVWLHPLEFSSLLEAAFNKIRQNSHMNEAMTIHLLHVFNLLASQTDDANYKAAISAQAIALMAEVDRMAMAGFDKEHLDDSYKSLMLTLESA